MHAARVEVFGRYDRTFVLFAGLGAVVTLFTPGADCHRTGRRSGAVGLHDTAPGIAGLRAHTQNPLQEQQVVTV